MQCTFKTSGIYFLRKINHSFGSVTWHVSIVQGSFFISCEFVLQLWLYCNCYVTGFTVRLLESCLIIEIFAPQYKWFQVRSSEKPFRCSAVSVLDTEISDFSVRIIFISHTNCCRLWCFKNKHTPRGLKFTNYCLMVIINITVFCAHIRVFYWIGSNDLRSRY